MKEIRELIKLILMWLSAAIYRSKGSKILYYHDVFSTINYKALDDDRHFGTSLELFAKHVEVIRQEGYKIVQHITKPKGQVAIMFDDGFRGIWECRKYFYEQHICPTIFLPVEFIGEKSKGILTEEEICELQDHGFVFECHSWSHRPLTEVPHTEFKHELVDSKKYLEDLLSKKVESICLPLGYFTDDILENIGNAGYTTIYSSIPGSVDFRPHGMLPRNLCQFATPEEVRLILRGGNEILKSRYEKLHNYTSK